MELRTLFRDLYEDEYGILRADAVESLSFPEDGNEVCFDLEDGSFWFRHRNDVIAAAVSKFPPPDGPMVDVGGGNGFVTRRLLDDGFKVILMEPGETGAFNARVNRNLPWVVCPTLNQSGLADKSLSAVGCFDVMEHIEDDAGFLEEIARALKPGGMLYITVPAGGRWLWSQTDVYSGHFRRYSRKSIVKLLEVLFEPLYCTYFFGCLTLPLFLLKALPTRLGLLRKEAVFSPRTEHGVDGGLAISIVERLLRSEVRMIKEGRSKRWGTSCLVVARRR